MELLGLPAPKSEPVEYAYQPTELEREIARQSAIENLILYGYAEEGKLAFDEWNDLGKLDAKHSKSPEEKLLVHRILGAKIKYEAGLYALAKETFEEVLWDARDLRKGVLVKDLEEWCTACSIGMQDTAAFMIPQSSAPHTEPMFEDVIDVLKLKPPSRPLSFGPLVEEKKIEIEEAASIHEAVAKEEGGTVHHDERNLVPHPDSDILNKEAEARAKIFEALNAWLDVLVHERVTHLSRIMREIEELRDALKPSQEVRPSREDELFPPEERTLQ